MFRKGRRTFEKYGGEPRLKGGNYGIETCVQR